MKLETECGATIWCGFFGKDEDGNHDECANTIVVEVEDERDEWELESSGEGWLGAVVVRCGACGILLEWPQLWYEVDNDEPERGFKAERSQDWPEAEPEDEE